MKLRRSRTHGARSTAVRAGIERPRKPGVQHGDRGSVFTGSPHHDGRDVANSAAVTDVKLKFALSNAQKTHL